ncbi:hypothetical protein K457DRAFT_1873906 [Linnemannia elongata AG-77]|uniref:Uncharacterized protein n=1 Tax=Linnemannia elongata AG-77 TaxID=1314771 RepID=A0A197K2X3_9FUNG|nr:hypothetical protein K457DRAFT_1873906 [Linnemannia elongata AG-77]
MRSSRSENIPSAAPVDPLATSITAAALGTAAVEVVEGWVALMLISFASKHWTPDEYELMHPEGGDWYHISEPGTPGSILRHTWYPR